MFLIEGDNKAVLYTGDIRGGFHASTAGLNFSVFC